MARALGLNEDLTEALALAHDIGHPPFGHAGEDVLQAAMAAAGGFDHNAHTIRLLTRLETPYPGFDGLNLSWETLEGLAKHNGPVARPPWALAEADASWPLELASWPGLEAQVAAIADDIAYDNHDIDDGLRAGLFTLDDLIGAAAGVGEAWEACARPPSRTRARLVPELVRDLIGRMVNDVLDETGNGAWGSASVDEVPRRRPPARRLLGRAGGRGAGAQGLPPRPHVRRARGAGRAREGAGDARRIVRSLSRRSAPPPARMAPGGTAGAVRAIGDFIAGMTDRYAIRRPPPCWVSAAAHY